MLVEDLSIYFADFGVDATLAGVTVRVIFDDGYLDPALGERGVATTEPQVLIATASVPGSVHKQALVVPGKGNFTVIGHQRDGTGMSVLELERAP